MISEVRRNRGDARVRERVASIRESDLFISVLTIGELTKGVSLLAQGKRRSSLQAWLLTLEQEYGDRVLPVDHETARIWGELSAAAQRRGKAVPACDGLIGATAIRHGLHVMTRDVGHFERSGVMVIDPWSA